MIRTLSLPVLFLAFMTSAVPSVAFSQDITVKHAKGETTVAAEPKTVVVFDMASLDTLDALGVKVTGVPGGRKPDYLKKYESDDYSKVGTLFEPDYEAVNAAAPDLIIVGGRSSAKYADLAKIAPTIDLSVDPDDFVASAKSNAETLGKLFHKEKEVADHIAKLDASTAALKKKAATAGKGLLILTTGGKMSAYGPGSRFGVIHTDFGFVPARDKLDVGTHGQAISFEFILETNPDWLFVIDRDAAIGREGEAASQFLDNDIVGQTNAWKNGRVVYLNAAGWYVVGGGLTALQKNVDQLTEALSKG